jgi:hypothetical protein
MYPNKFLNRNAAAAMTPSTNSSTTGEVPKPKTEVRPVLALRFLVFILPSTLHIVGRDDRENLREYVRLSPEERELEALC